MSINLKQNRGEIATVLTLISVGLMLMGVVVGNVAVQQTTRTQSKAAACYGSDSECKNNCESKICGPCEGDFVKGFECTVINPIPTSVINPTNYLTPIPLTITPFPTFPPQPTSDLKEPSPTSFLKCQSGEYKDTDACYKTGCAICQTCDTGVRCLTAPSTFSCGIMNNGQECKPKDDKSENFCYNECLPWKPGYSQPVFCKFPEGFVTKPPQVDPACGAVGPTPELKNCPAGKKDGDVINSCVQMQCDGVRDSWVEIDEVCKDGKTTLVPARDTGKKCSESVPSCNNSRVTPIYKPPPTPTLLPKPASCYLYYECKNGSGYKAYKSGNKYFRDSECRQGQTISDNPWDLCKTTKCEYSGGRCVSSCPSAFQQKNMDCNTSSFCCGTLISPTPFPAPSSQPTCKLTNQEPKLTAECVKCILDNRNDIKNLKPSDSANCSQEQILYYWCNGGSQYGTPGQTDCSNIKTKNEAGKCGDPKYNCGITPTLGPSVSPTPTTSSSQDITFKIEAIGTTSIRKVGNNSKIEIYACLTNSTVADCTKITTINTSGEKEVYNTVPITTDIKSHGPVSIESKYKYANACLILSGETTPRCNSSRTSISSTTSITINLSGTSETAYIPGGPITASFDPAGWNYVVNNYNKYEALEVSSWAHASAESGYYPGIQHIFCDVKLGTQPGGCDFYYQNPQVGT